MLRTHIIVFVFTALILAGCANSANAYPNPEEETPTSPPLPTSPASGLPTLEGDWEIKMTHSGGIMGLLRTIQISSDGKYTVTDERKNQTVSGKLAANELTKLTEVVSSSKYAAPSGPERMICADCFVFDLTIQGNDTTLTTQLNDISLPESGLAPLVSYLRGIIDKALK